MQQHELRSTEHLTTNRAASSTAALPSPLSLFCQLSLPFRPRQDLSSSAPYLRYLTIDVPLSPFGPLDDCPSQVCASHYVLDLAPTIPQRSPPPLLPSSLCRLRLPPWSSHPTHHIIDSPPSPLPSSLCFFVSHAPPASATLSRSPAAVSSLFSSFSRCHPRPSAGERCPQPLRCMGWCQKKGREDETRQRQRKRQNTTANTPWLASLHACFHHLCPTSVPYSLSLATLLRASTFSASLGQTIPALSTLGQRPNRSNIVEQTG